MEKVKLLPNNNPTIIESEVGDQVLLYDPIEDKFHALNLAAKLIWELSKSGSNELEAAKTFKVYFGGKETDYIKDISSVIKELQKLRIFHEDSSTNRTSSLIDLKLKPHAHPLQYESPRVITYTSEWMKSNHPSAFLSVRFSDRWGPACD